MSVVMLIIGIACLVVGTVRDAIVACYWLRKGADRREPAMAYAVMGVIRGNRDSALVLVG
jgi:hypothetical protein